MPMNNSYTTAVASTPSPILFPAGSPTPKLACHTPSKKPPSPFDWATECLKHHDEAECEATASWHFEEIERIGMQLETDPMVLERLREKANPTPEERYVLKWMDDTKSDNEHNASLSEEQQQQQGVATTPAAVIISRARNLRNFFTRFTTKRS
ncbi:hypothetical protein O0I10_000839 [Lichtheimia ornata]|uniref:Uncharacterized protein n=1 Tax=Lichtheimia ornata TaxID=688661 RepID=A0AAD7Y4D4_9FUNG|nr:uncharacterized protein O0I10_000839 [Lichtheimia ornata]KAJ8663594.1 hypothetical protein O0I10_000839 [Lichtheimia ornata]